MGIHVRIVLQIVQQKGICTYVAVPRHAVAMKKEDCVQEKPSARKILVSCKIFSKVHKFIDCVTKKMKELICLFSLNLLPTEMMKIVLSFFAESLQDRILLDLETRGFSTIVAARSAVKRKQWHLWAAKLEFHHFGFVDKSKESEITTVYKCPNCNKWRYFHRNSLREVTCCSDEDGDATCPNSFYVCDECDNILIYSGGDVANGVIKKTWARNNKILFLKEMNYKVAKRMGLSKKAIQKVLRRRSCLE